MILIVHLQHQVNLVTDSFSFSKIMPLINFRGFSFKPQAYPPQQVLQYTLPRLQATNEVSEDLPLFIE